LLPALPPTAVLVLPPAAEVSVSLLTGLSSELALPCTEGVPPVPASTASSASPPLVPLVPLVPAVSELAFSGEPLLSCGVQPASTGLQLSAAQTKAVLLFICLIALCREASKNDQL
jgi:hypothetical protein